MIHAVATPAREPVSAPGRGAVAAAYEAVYEEHFDFVWRNVRRLGVDEANADDATQEVFLVVHRRLGEFEGRSSMRTWLYGVVVNVVRDHRRARTRYESRVTASASVQEGTSPSPADWMAKKEAQSTLEGLLAQIDDEKREVFVLVELEELTVAEVASALDLNVNTAHARLRAGRQQFEDAAKHYRAKENR